METRRRSRVILKAVSGVVSAGSDSSHHQLELLDDSEMSESNPKPKENSVVGDSLEGESLDGGRRYQRTQSLDSAPLSKHKLTPSSTLPLRVPHPNDSAQSRSKSRTKPRIKSRIASSRDKSRITSQNKSLKPHHSSSPDASSSSSESDLDNSITSKKSSQPKIDQILQHAAEICVQPKLGQSSSYTSIFCPNSRSNYSHSRRPRIKYQSPPQRPYSSSLDSLISPSCNENITRPKRFIMKHFQPDPNEGSDIDVEEASLTPKSLSVSIGGRTPSLSESVGSGNLTPLLTSDLRSRSGRSRWKWEFDAENQLESYFPDRNIRVYIVTWNMQERKELPKHLDDLLLPANHDFAADMFVIGTQESTPSRKEWEVLIQQTLGPAYVCVRSSSLGVIYMSLFIRRDLIWFCSEIRTDTHATRPVTIIKTKGAVSISFTLFGSSFLFITSHFTGEGDIGECMLVWCGFIIVASRHKVEERNIDMQKIATNLTSSGGTSSHDEITTKFDYVFWFGDLNYRVDMDRATADECLASSNCMSLLLQDQLTKEILQGNVFGGFSEQPIAFSPSYKYDVESDDYDTSEKQRVPSWTDRILFKSLAGTGISGCGYFCCQSLKCSDHRPVCALFRVKLAPSYYIGGIPDSVAGFDKEIYMRANKQRKILIKKASSLKKIEVEVDKGSLKKHSNNTATSQICLIL